MPYRNLLPGVYAIREVATGRRYIGSSKHIPQRWSGHKCEFRKGINHVRKEMQEIWSERGPDAFILEILEIVPDVGNLKEREQVWIDLLRASDATYGFNLYPDSRGPKGFIHSLETRQTHSAARKGMKMPPRSEEHKAAISEAKKGIKPSPETRAKMSAARLGKKRAPFSPEHKAAISAAKLGTKASAEARAQMSASRKGRKMPPFSDAHKEAIRAAALGRKHSAESRAKMSAQRKGRPRHRKNKMSSTTSTITPNPPPPQYMPG